MYVSLSLPPVRSLGSVQPKPHREFMGAEEESAVQICIHHRQVCKSVMGEALKSFQERDGNILHCRSGCRRSV